MNKLLLAAVLSIHSFAALAVPKPNNELVPEGEVVSNVGELLIEQIMSSLDTSKTRCQGFFHVRGGQQSGKTRFELPYLNAQCMLYFNEDVQIALIPEDPDANHNVDKVIPYLNLGIKNLRVIPQVLIDNRDAQAEQYLRLDVCGGFQNDQCIRKPIRVTVHNQNAAGILNIGLYGLVLHLKNVDGLEKRKEFSGYCDSEQEVLDFEKLENKLIKPKCEISGYWDPANPEDPFGYEIKYLSAE